MVSVTTRIYTVEQKSRQRDMQRLRRASNPDKYKKITRESERRRRYKRYGLTESSYQEKLNSQQNCCAICFTTHPGGKHTWHIDHNHISGRVRGLLCHHCNIMLGNAKDNIVVLSSAIRYLKKHNNV